MNSSFLAADEVRLISHGEEHSKTETSLENLLLPWPRKVIRSLEDLVEFAGKILIKIFSVHHNHLFTCIMEVVNDLNERIEDTNENSLKGRQKELIEKIKEKIAEIQTLENNKKERAKLEVKKNIINHTKQLDALEMQLIEVTKDEEAILQRILKLCEFIIKHCNRVPSHMYDNMLHDFIFPTLQRKQFPEVMLLSYTAMGLLSLNYFNSNYQNFLKLFFDNLSRMETGDFKEFDMISLLVIFDSILQNNIQTVSKEVMSGTIDEKIDQIIRKYLYHNQYTPRVVVFLGLCKLLIAKRTARPEFILSRLLVVLAQSFEIMDKQSEDFHLKIQEIMSNFVYFYTMSDKSHTKAIVKAVLIVLTAQMVVPGDNTYERNVVSDYLQTKLEFLHHFLFLINDQTGSNDTARKIIFKVFKYLHFLYAYITEDHAKAFMNLEIKEDNKKKVNISYNCKKNIKPNMKKFFDKLNYDKSLFQDEEGILKLFPYLDNLNLFDGLKGFSQFLTEEYASLKEKNFVLENGDRKLNLNDEEKINEMRDYVRNKEMKYYKAIEENYAFIMTLREDRLNVIFEENSKILEEEENEEQERSNMIKKGKKKSNQERSIRQEVEGNVLKCNRIRTV